MIARFLRSWGFGPLFALDAIRQILAARSEAQAAIDRQVAQ